MMKQAQIRQLKDELRQVDYINSREQARRQHPKPPAVKAAERVCAKHEALLQRTANRIERTFQKLKAKATHEIFFGDETRALKALRAVIAFHEKHHNSIG